MGWCRAAIVAHCAVRTVTCPATGVSAAPPPACLLPSSIHQYSLYFSAFCPQLDHRFNKFCQNSNCRKQRRGDAPGTKIAPAAKANVVMPPTTRQLI